jgi:hypothetical protein
MCANFFFFFLNIKDTKPTKFVLADLQPSLWTTARHLANAVTSDMWPHECFVSLRMALLLSLITSEVRQVFWVFLNVIKFKATSHLYVGQSIAAGNEGGAIPIHLLLCGDSAAAQQIVETASSLCLRQQLCTSSSSLRNTSTVDVRTGLPWVHAGLLLQAKHAILHLPFIDTLKVRVVL